MRNDLLTWLTAIEYGDIGNTIAGGCDLNPQLLQYLNAPFLFVLPEPLQDCLLPQGMLTLSHWAFLNLSIHVLGIRLVGGAQVNLNRNMCRCRHDASPRSLEDTSECSSLSYNQGCAGLRLRLRASPRTDRARTTGRTRGEPHAPLGTGERRMAGLVV